MSGADATLGGTSLEGHITAPYGGICVDMSRMDKVIAVRGKSFTFVPVS
jgi:FAD/FMN-containing dehydrogenase